MDPLSFPIRKGISFAHVPLRLPSHLTSPFSIPHGGVFELEYVPPPRVRRTVRGGAAKGGSTMPSEWDEATSAGNSQDNRPPTAHARHERFPGCRMLTGPPLTRLASRPAAREPTGALEGLLVSPSHACTRACYQHRWAWRAITNCSRPQSRRGPRTVTDSWTALDTLDCERCSDAAMQRWARPDRPGPMISNDGPANHAAMAAAGLEFANDGAWYI